jgi:hypothetical protein
VEFDAKVVAVDGRIDLGTSGGTRDFCGMRELEADKMGREDEDDELVVVGVDIKVTALVIAGT